MKKLFTLFAVAAMAFAANAATLDVCMGDGYGSTLPIYGLWADTEGTLGQMIYPAEMLQDMVGAEISEIKFYTAINGYEAWGIEPVNGVRDYINFEGATIQLSLKVVDEISFASETVYEDVPAVATVTPEMGDRYLDFVLDGPFVYEGGNLLVECKIIATEGDWGGTYFWVENFDIEGYNPGLYSYPSYSGTTTYIYLVSYLPAATFTYEGGEEPGPGPDPENPYAEGYWLMVINADGEAVPYQLMLGDNGDYTTTVKFGYNDFGTYDPATEERPNVPFYFIVNGVCYGAEEALIPATLGFALDNPLFEGEGTYTVPVGYNYNIGIAFGLEGDMYAYVAQANATGIDEIAGKAVAGVRYFNVAGQEMQEANGLTIVVTTYTDGTSSAVKVVK